MLPLSVAALSRCLASSPLGLPLSSLASLDIQMAPYFPKLGEEVVPVSITTWKHDKCRCELEQGVGQCWSVKLRVTNRSPCTGGGTTAGWRGRMGQGITSSGRAAQGWLQAGGEEGQHPGQCPVRLHCHQLLWQCKPHPLPQSTGSFHLPLYSSSHLPPGRAVTRASDGGGGLLLPGS